MFNPMVLPLCPSTIIETAFVAETTRHEYRVGQRWDQDPVTFIDDPVLLPFAALAATADPTQLLHAVAHQVCEIESNQQRREISAYVQWLATNADLG